MMFGIFISGHTVCGLLLLSLQQHVIKAARNQALKQELRNEISW